jgi:hypothetical protein
LEVLVTATGLMKVAGQPLLLGSSETQLIKNIEDYYFLVNMEEKDMNNESMIPLSRFLKKLLGISGENNSGDED